MSQHQLFKQMTRNFINSFATGYIEKVSRQDVLDFINSFGNFPLLTKNWTETDLNFTKIFNEIKLEYLLNMRVNFCPHPTASDDIVCLYPVQQHTWERYKTTSINFTIKDVHDMLNILRIPVDGVEDIVKGFYKTSLLHPTSNDHFHHFGPSHQTLVVSINQLSNHFNSSEMEWIKVINAQIPQWLQQDGSSLVFIKDVVLLRNRLNFLRTVDKR